MALKPGKNLDELCYPFIYETAYLCDYEVITDELCGHIGAVLADLPDEMADLRADLEQLQPLAFHLNGSVHGPRWRRPGALPMTWQRPAARCAGGWRSTKRTSPG